MKKPVTIRHGELCKLLEIPARLLSYILEQGHLPQGVRREPRTGNPREFNPGQAFWLAIVVKLRQTGLTTPLAAQVADYAAQTLRSVTQNLNWDFRFRPDQAEFDTEHQYMVEVGDLEWVRLVTDASPSRKEDLEYFPWQPVTGRRSAPAELRPFVTLRVDLSRIAAQLKTANAWSLAERNL